MSDSPRFAVGDRVQFHDSDVLRRGGLAWVFEAIRVGAVFTVRTCFDAPTGHQHVVVTGADGVARC
jgi:hypothetical protein